MLATIAWAVAAGAEGRVVVREALAAVEPAEAAAGGRVVVRVVVREAAAGGRVAVPEADAEAQRVAAGERVAEADLPT